jgi:hypothetical protein
MPTNQGFAIALIYGQEGLVLNPDSHRNFFFFFPTPLRPKDFFLLITKKQSAIESSMIVTASFFLCG